MAELIRERWHGKHSRRADPLGKQRVGIALALLPMAWLGLFLVAPLGLLLLWSFQQPGIGAQLNFPLSIESYQLNLDTPSDWIVLGKTVGTAFAVAVGAVLLGYPVAYVLALLSDGRKRYTLLLLALLPFLTGYLLRIFAWRLLLGRTGIINFILQLVGIIHEPLGFFLFSRVAVVVVLVYVWVPWAALPIFVRLDQMDRSLLWAAADLGASPIRAFARVTLPLSLNGVYVAFLFVFIPTLGDFATANAVGGTNGVMLGNIIQGLLTTLVYPSGAVLTVLILVAALASMLLGSRFVRFEDWARAAKSL